MYLIEKKITRPAAARRGRPIIYPFRDMSVGDSFEFSIKKYNSATSSANHASKQTGYKFSFRSDGKRVRVWRIK